jgi:uncharacterized protein YbaR (Trm112 family)/SAM-dependent methyltransferase
MLPPQEEKQRDDSVDIKEGVLICEKCGHWFPIRDFIPELLPDLLRDWERDIEFFKTLKQKLSEEIFKELLDKSQAFARQGSAVSVEDEGMHYKKSEMSIKSKVTDDDFFGPGFSSPFNPGNPEFTMHLIRRLGNVLPLLELKQEDVVLDIGVGYAWTTEWLKKMGIHSIGVDICRTYMDIGLKRMGENRPHLVLGDIENLPIKSHVLNAVLCYDAFHHIPNRKKAMGHFFRALKGRGNIVLAEPGGAHEFAEISKEAMTKYGILEKGMDLEDVSDYCVGLNVLPPEQHFILKIHRDEQNKILSPEFVHSHSYVDCNVYVVKKRLGEGESQELVSHSSTFIKKIKRKLKRLLTRIFLKLLY